MPHPARPALLALLAVSLALSAAPGTAQGNAGAFLAARAAQEAGDFRAAAEYFQRALIRDPQNPALMEGAIQALVALGEIARSVPIAQAMRRAGHRSQLAGLVLLADAALRDDFAAIAGTLSEGGELGPVVQGLAAAWAELGRGRMSEAIAAFDALAARQGLAGLAGYHKALALAAAGDFEGAARLLSGAEAGPLRLSRRGVIGYAQVLSQLDRQADALALLEEAFGRASDPTLADLRARLAAGEALPFTLVRTARDGLAEAFHTVALALQGEAADAFTLLYARLAVALRPDHVDALLLVGRLLDQLGQTELAEAAFARVPADSLSFHAAQIGRAEALFRGGRRDEALVLLDALAATHPDEPSVFVTKGDLLRRASRFEEAAAAYDRAIALIGPPERHHWSLFYWRAVCNERLKRWDLAEPDFLKALELEPDQPEVLNYLGYSWVEMRKNLDQALEMIARAVEQRPDNGYIVDSLAWVLYRLGRYDEALPHMERAVQLLPTDPILNDHLGDIYWAVGRRVEAQFQWRRALQFGPEEEEVPRIRRKLEVGLDRVLEEEGEPPLAVSARRD